MSLLRQAYLTPAFLNYNEYVGPIDSYEFKLISPAPLQRSGYLASIRVFDLITWALILLSLVMVTIALIMINHVSRNIYITCQIISAYESNK